MIAAILDTGAYGSYVWGSFGLALAVHAWNLLAPRRQREAIVKQLAEDA
jgi:heme exporter protein CcmD